MKYIKFLVLVVSPLFLHQMSSSCSSVDQKGNNQLNYALLVNPMIGTDFTGNTYPGAQAPFGMVQLSPDNGLPGWDRIAGYFYPDSTIAGFSHTHLSGTGAGDLYDISFMPVMLPYNQAEAPLGIYSKFSHDDEEASAGYYRVKLLDYNINVELTATERVGVQRYTFPAGDAAIFLDLKKAMNWDSTVDTEISVVDSCTIEGYRYSSGWSRDQRVFFRTRFSRPWDSITIDSTALRNDVVNSQGMVARFDFKTNSNEQIIVSTAISGVNADGAAVNLLAEVPTDDFDKVLALTQENWNKELGKYKVECDDKDRLVTFYTALYHSMIAPTIYSDVDGGYRGPDKNTHKTDGWVNYSTFSLWDTFRASHPLFTITQQVRVNDMIKSFLAFYEQNGRLPVWNFQGGETDMMLGYHAVPVIVDAYLKGIGDFDALKALDACVKTANIDEYRGIGLYKTLGYVPYNVVDEYNSDNWSMSRTLEYAFDDYCIALMADKLGKKDIADEFYSRAKNYKNHFNPATRFMQPRDDKGGWQPNFSPDEYTPHISESNAWQYFWSVQHDIHGLINLMGGKEPFALRLDSMFTYTGQPGHELPIFSTGMIGQYAHGNEPGHHVIYLYNYVGQPWKTAKYARHVMDQFYTNTPEGLCGNEDLGQMSAWYVFSVMGLYPVNPVSGIYEIGTPLFKNITVNLENGKQFKVIAPKVSSENKYVKSVKINGEKLYSSFITHEQIMNGAILEFEMTNQEGINWFSGDK